ncbi:MAG: glycosyltransferase family 1 protein [Candidatus Scalindua sp. AMX11]|nr:MAG: glycosyltransferase family 1 protein [Candidatus Scalindua sp.]NOG83443.1 glycosyltransferase family 4 protein [Planctomycetota bacterium]RZV75047.1 MAG: glycosyltransferase family 1 protein [Candidatus Scalindua sp. SCAELEC01]TDE64308.1 MAG: glycosyltransferase family 1 protein [Candidatus Scalindua sp. AMX11]GJQ60633.1 MAG: glycosyl transferase family 1 [Candidatus Scalindua sp.]
MKILHLYSDWKWTGPAEPALNLCVALKKFGHDVTFACGKAMDDYPFPPDSESVEKSAYERGLVPVTKFKLNKHFRFFQAMSDLKKLIAFMDNEAFDLLHVHRSYDHLVGGIAARRAKKFLPIVRTNHDGVGLVRGLRNTICITKLTDALIDVSEEARKVDALNFRLPDGAIFRIDASIDCERFRPQNDHSSFRKKLGIGKEDIVVGIIARIQTHRRFDVLLEALKIARREEPRLRMLVIGRGTKEKQLLTDPARKMGLSDAIIHTGYRTGDYVDVVSCMDFNVFLVPGSDGSCRAVREVMAMEIPVIAANRGMLPEIVDHNTTGLVIEDTSENLATAFVTLSKDESLRKRFAKASLEKAQEVFSLEPMAKRVEEVYEKLLS